MPRILFLLGDTAVARNDNHERLPKGFRTCGWEVTERPHDSVQICAGSLAFGDIPAEQFDLIWPMGFGQASSFFDRMQLLSLLESARLVTGPEALTFLHGKYRWLEDMPETHAAASVEVLAAVIGQGGDWVVKPPAGSYGRGVVLIRNGEDPRPHLQQLVFPNRCTQPQYCIAQRFIPEIVHGETRTLVASGNIIGSYLRLPTDALHANLSAHASATSTRLSASQELLVLRLAGELLTLGAQFAAIDIVGDRLLEVNIANPGGLATLQDLYGVDHSEQVARHIIARAAQAT